VSKLSRGRSETGGAARQPDAPTPSEPFSEEQVEQLSALEMLDHVAREVALQGATPPTIMRLRRRIA